MKTSIFFLFLFSVSLLSAQSFKAKRAEPAQNAGYRDNDESNDYQINTEPSYDANEQSVLRQQVLELGLQNQLSNSTYYSSNRSYNSFAGENILLLNINALSNQKAKEYVAIFNVTQIGATAEEADRLLNERVTAFVNAAKQIGLSKEAIYTDMVSFLPRYEIVAAKKTFSKKTFTEVPKGFILQKNLHIRYTQPEVLDLLISAAAKSEIYEIVKVDYTVENPNEIYQELRTRSFDYLNQVIASYKKVGINLDSAYKITTEDAFATYPSSRYNSYKSFTTFSIESLKNSPITEAEKTTTSYYNAVPPDAYDIVINPTILEPAVQYTFSLKIKFTLKERTPYTKIETQTKKEVYIVTPNGDMKKIEVDK